MTVSDAVQGESLLTQTGLNIREAFQLLIEQVKLVNPAILEEQWNYKMAHRVIRNGHIPDKSHKECRIL